MGWSDETIDCFGTSAIVMSAKCERLVAEALGEPVPPPDVPAGPAQAWSFTLPLAQTIIHGCGDGSVIAVFEPGPDDPPGEGAAMIAIADGKERWRKPMPVSPWSIEPLDAATVLVVLPRELVAVAIADGSERWRTALPADESDPGPRAILREGERLTIIDAQRRVLSVDPSRCSKGACVQDTGKLPSEDPEGALRVAVWGPVGLARLPDKGLAIAAPDDGRVVVLDENLALRFAIESHATLSWVETRGSDLVVALDGEVIGVDPSKCGTRADTFAPATWPPPGKPDWLRDATLREGEWDPTPEGCVKWRRRLAVAEASDPPVAGFDDAMIVQAGGFHFALTPDAELWKSATAAQSFAVKHRDRIAVLGDVGSGDTELAVMWLDPKTGQHVARTETAIGKGKLFLLDGPALVSAGELVVAGYERELVAFEGPAR
jgi:hypothetical protein